MSRRSNLSHVFLAAIVLLGASLSNAADIEVRGTVLRPTGEPLPGVRVHLVAELSQYDLAETSLRGEILPGFTAAGETDKRGRYRLVAPQAGLFRIRVEADGSFPLATGPLALTGPTEIAPVVPPAASQMRARVVDAKDRPVAGAWVQARGPAERRFARELPKPWGLASRTARTAADGQAFLPQLPGELLEILAFQAGAVEARTEGASAEAVLRLSLATASLDVIAVGADGQPLAGVLVQIGQGGWTAARTGADGRVSLAAAPGTLSRLRLLAPDGRRLGVELPPSSTSPYRVALPALFTVTGIVRTGPAPLAGAFVWSPEEPGLRATTDETGQYRLPTAVRSLRVEAAGFLSRQTRLTEVEIRRGRAPTLALQPATSLVGTVLDESGTALEGIVVAATLDGGPPGLSPSVVIAWGSSDRAGRFELRGLTPGTPYRVEDAQAGLFGAPQTVIASRPGAPPPPLRLVLAASQGVRGRVLDLAGQPVPEAEVLLRAARPPKRSDLQPIEPLRPEEEPYRAWTDAHGIFTVRELPALDVDLIARKPGFAPSVVRGLQIRPGKTPHSAGDIVLRPGVRLAGRVVDRAGRGIVGAAVHSVQQIDDLDRLEARLRERQPAAVSAGDGSFVLDDQPSGVPLNLVVAAQGFIPAGLRGVRAPVARPIVVRLDPAELVRGRVLDEDGAGIPGARISLEWRSSLPEKPSIRTSEHAVRTAVSDREGRFELRSVPEGSGEVTVEADGFVASDPLSVAVPQDPRNPWTVVLQRGATLEGKISTRQGDPVGGVRVTAESAQARSDDDGKYLLAGVPPGEIEVEVVHADYPRQVHMLKIERGSNVFDVQLQDGHRVTGVILSAAREPVPGASVSLETLVEGRDQRAYRAHTGMTGTFELPTVADGEYRITASADGFAEEKPAETITIRGDDRNDLEVVLDRGASIVGRVLGLPREELAWVEVSAEGDDVDAGSPVVRVDAEGRFALRHLAPGNWQVRARHPQRQREVEVRAVLRTHGEEAVRDLRFGGGLSLTGRVVLADEPLAGALVSLRAQSHSLERSAVTDYRGEFELADLDTDRYHLGVIDRKTLALHNEDLVLDEDRQIEIQLRSGTVSGNVLDGSSRAPVAGALLALRPLEGADFMIAGTSEEDGSFLLPKVPEGRYRLATSADGYTSAEQEVEVAGAGAAGLDVKLAPTQGLDLVVRLASGQPPRLVHLRATSAGGSALSETRIVGADGRLRMATLPAGEWNLWIAAPGGASLQTKVRAPGETVRIDLPPAGRLSVQVPDLAESSLLATVAVRGESRQPFSTLTFGGEISSTWPLKAGMGVVEDLPAGAWAVEVHAPDGRTWTKQVATTGGDGTVSFE